MPKYIGFVGGTSKEHRVIVEGETLKEAMEKAAYLPLNQSRNNNRLVGQLTDGRRYSFRTQPARSDELYELFPKGN
jgi:hypothetical protein